MGKTNAEKILESLIVPGTVVVPGFCLATVTLTWKVITQLADTRGDFF